MPKYEYFSHDEIADLLRAKINFDYRQVDLARELGVSSSFISQILHGGTARIGKKFGRRILERLGFEPTPYFRRKISYSSGKPPRRR